MLSPKPGTRELAETFDAFQTFDNKPWWFVVQTFGRNVTVRCPAPYWRNPTYAEVRGMMNLALAYGAKGLFFYSFQSEGLGPALVRPQSLAAEDRKLAAVSRVARKVARLKSILLPMAPADLDLASHSPEVAARPYRGSGARYVYVVNQETDGPAEATVVVRGVQATAATDAETGRTVTAVQTDAGVRLSCSLEPGEGRLIRLR